jgi:hypothetical protein
MSGGAHLLDEPRTIVFKMILLVPKNERREQTKYQLEVKK